MNFLKGIHVSDCFYGWRQFKWMWCGNCSLFYMLALLHFLFWFRCDSEWNWVNTINSLESAFEMISPRLNFSYIFNFNMNLSVWLRSYFVAFATNFRATIWMLRFMPFFFRHIKEISRIFLQSSLPNTRTSIYIHVDVMFAVNCYLGKRKVAFMMWKELWAFLVKPRCFDGFISESASLKVVFFYHPIQIQTRSTKTQEVSLLVEICHSVFSNYLFWGFS